MAPLTQTAPRSAHATVAATLAIVTALTVATLAAPARAQQPETAAGLAAPPIDHDVATLRAAPAAASRPPLAPPPPAGDRFAVRVVAELGVEVLTLGAAIAAPAVLAGLSAPNCTAELFCIAPGTFAAVFGGLGAVLGEALVPPLLGAVASAFGGRGDVGAAYVGLLVGDAIAAGAVAGGLALGDPGALATLSVLGGLAALAGPIVGYELASASAARGVPHVAPTVAPTPGGAIVGVAGSL